MVGGGKEREQIVEDCFERYFEIIFDVFLKTDLSGDIDFTSIRNEVVSECRGKIDGGEYYIDND